MKIAVPTKGNVVDDHFGHCDEYTVFTVVEKQITETEKLPSPKGCGCKSNIASILQNKGVSVMLAGNMGNGALNKLNNFGIDVIRGCQGDVSKLAESFIAGTLNDSGVACQAHGHAEEGHQCQH
ncbi:NifB/NifX family molybdenum-iron cluster-binding protein [Carboxylicivirga sp. N1Y90]|uniref:NifB/NifX family molybdenum-iron cluster-binding protein n=1 Tax=Carboxylicivirga fragile TaxID=3417571 RepID=UPI003D33E39E|nr:NifB/NifX family molybdenum-iron cluster-binding protein [Marinilabiliaceae bacterium N1Y90]